ncbi:MAG: hypothetical protein ACJ8ER_11230 [Allosphingosinicella sp.]
MTALGLIGILLSLAGFRFARVSESRARFGLFALLLIAHLGATVGYYLYAQEFGGDVLMYYYDPYGVYGRYTGLSTVFLINFTQTLKETIGGSFFDYFLLFQAMGFWGILFVLRTFDDVHKELGRPLFSRVYLLLFLPGLHFWTSAIGKDSPLFLAVAMCTWAGFRLQSRYPAFVAGLVIALLIRPHIALIALIALSLTILLEPRTRLIIRIALLAVSLACTLSVGGLVESSFNGLNLSNADSVSDFLATRSGVSEEAGGDVSIVSASFPVKLISLLFRPFFVDAAGAMGYLASIENVVLLIVVGTLLWRFRSSLNVARRALFARFSMLFFVLLTVLLAMVNYNIGLGLRQKMMMMPALLVFYASLMAVRAAQRQMVYGPPPGAYAGGPVAVTSYRGAA